MHLLLAHQGGWDELLWFTVPIVAVLLWVRWAERRSRKRREGAATTLPPDSDTDEGTR